MTKPVELLTLMAKVTNRIFLWTHDCDPEQSNTQFTESIDIQICKSAIPIHPTPM